MFLASPISFPNLGITVDPDPVAFTIFGKDIYWYGIIIAAGFLLAVLYMMRRAKEFGVTDDDVLDMVLWAAPIGVICARLYYCVFYWDLYRDNPISALYIWEGPAAPETIGLLRSQLPALRTQHPSVEFGSLEVALANVRDEDWENSWKQYYQPLPIGKRLLVVPEWLHPENPEQRVEVLLDPGMIFGTGAHASTQMCMRELERTVHGGERVLDLGSGSGILSITALLLGAKTATGVDIDPKAEDIARENAAINGLHDDRFRAVTGDVIGDKAMMERLGSGYDIVLANIVADVIIPLSPIVPRFLTDEGVFICSGTAGDVHRFWRRPHEQALYQGARGDVALLLCGRVARKIQGRDAGLVRHRDEKL